MRKFNKHFTLSVMLAFASLISSFSIVTYSQMPTPTVPPSNDMFANAEVINGSDGRATGYNYLASLETNEPASCAGCKTVWYRWTAPADVSITFSVHGDWPIIVPVPYLNDSVLGVYMGNDVGSLTMLTWNDDVRAGDRTSRVTFAARSGQVYNIRVYGGSGTEGVINLWWEINGAESWKQNNFDGCYSMERYPTGRSKSDFGVFRPSDGFWWLNSFFSPYKTVAWGLPEDITVPGDYLGDGCSDIAIWRPSDGNFWILDMPTGNTTVVKWGMLGDIPVRGDFDGDDKADLAIWRPTNATFWVLNSSDGSISADQFGWPGDVPACADYDGDGKTDLAVHWHEYGPGGLMIRRSSDFSYMLHMFGYFTDVPVPGDYDHDGKADMAVYRPQTGAFFIYRSSDLTTMTFLIGNGVAVAGDYVGGQGSDVCVWQAANGMLSCIDPIGQASAEFQWGVNGDIPIAGYTAY